MVTWGKAFCVPSAWAWGWRGGAGLLRAQTELGPHPPSTRPGPPLAASLVCGLEESFATCPLSQQEVCLSPVIPGQGGKAPSRVFPGRKARPDVAPATVPARLWAAWATGWGPASHSLPGVWNLGVAAVKEVQCPLHTGASWALQNNAEMRPTASPQAAHLVGEVRLEDPSLLSLCPVPTGASTGSAQCLRAAGARALGVQGVAVWEGPQVPGCLPTSVPSCVAPAHGAWSLGEG